jgi:hypothetical protein
VAAHSLSPPGAPQEVEEQAMPAPPEDVMFLHPRWFVIGFALIAFALIINYDLRLGIAAGVVLGTFGALWLYLALRLNLVGDDRPTYRRRVLDRFRQQLSNRREAERQREDGSGA